MSDDSEIASVRIHTCYSAIRVVKENRLMLAGDDAAYM